MAGGPSTLALAAAVSGAGGLGFLAAGYKSAEVVERELAQVGASAPAGLPYGVNLFVPSDAADLADVKAYADGLRVEAERRGVTLGEPRWEDDGYAEKVDLVCQQPVPVVSLTFGCPSPSVVDRLHQSATAVWVTITTIPEAVAAQQVGADALIVQGVEAGGHRCGFDDVQLGLLLVASCR